MVKTNLKILEHEDKSSGGYDRTRFKCEYGDGSIRWMSAFRTSDEEKKIVESLKANENKLISVEVVEKPNSKDPSRPFFNLTGFYKVVDGTSISNPKETEKINKSAETSRNPYEKDPVGLAVEITCKVLEVDKEHEITGTEAMEKAIKIVKQAQEAFS